MDGRSILFSRCLIGLLAYFLFGLNFVYAQGKLFKSDTRNVTTSDPVSEAQTYLKTLYKGNYKLSFENCSKVMVDEGCIVWFDIDKLNANGDIYEKGSVSQGYFRIKTPLCDEKRGTSAGLINVPVPDIKISGNTAVLMNQGSFNNFSNGGFPTCFNSCMIASAGPVIKNETGGNVWGDTAGNAFMQMQMKYTGNECNDDKPDAPKPIGGPAPDKAPVPKPPKGPFDCPPKTTFGEVNGVAVCVKNAPLPTDPSPPPKPDEKDACIGNCDKWDPDAPKPTDPKNPNPTDPKDPNKPSTTPPTKGPLSSCQVSPVHKPVF